MNPDQMDLIADIGNTLVKTAVFSGNEMIFEQHSTVIEEALIENLVQTFPVRKAIISSVGSDPEKYLTILKEKLEYIILPDHTTPLPIINLYHSPETLGFDRLAAATGAHFLFPHTNLLIIDAGTAITIDLVSEAGEFRGGNISPGLDIRFKALKTFTNRLPLVDRDGDICLTGKTTEEAVRSGVWNGILYELDGYIDSYKQEYENLKVILIHIFTVKIALLELIKINTPMIFVFVVTVS